MSVTLDQAIPEFLSSRAARGIKRGTIANERSVLKQFLATTGNLLVKNLTSRHVDMYFSSYPHLGAGTWNRNIGYLQGFFKWCRGRRYAPKDWDPLEGVRLRKVPQRDFIFIPKERFGEVLDAAKTGRDRALLAIGLYTFQRASEITRLRWSDVWDSDLDPKKWRIAIYRPKTDERDWLPLCMELHKELRRWRLEYGNLVGEPPHSDWLIVPPYEHGQWGQDADGKLVRTSPLRLNPTMVWQAPAPAVHYALRRLGYEHTKQEGAHTLRRSGGLALYEELAWNRGHDAALRVVQSMYGHKNLATTEKYLRLKLETKRRNDLIAGAAMFPTPDADAILFPEQKVEVGIGQAQGDHR